MVAKVFISYRRDDTKYQARMIYAAFCKVLPRDHVFMDLASIPPGANFRKTLKSWVDQCEVLLALIGPRWIDASDPKTNRRRLDNPGDFVRIEIGEALARDIPVVPVLIDGTSLPDAGLLPDELKDLIDRQAEFVEFRTFEEDVERLISKLELGRGVERPNSRPQSSPARRPQTEAGQQAHQQQGRERTEAPQRPAKGARRLKPKVKRGADEQASTTAKGAGDVGAAGGLAKAPPQLESRRSEAAEELPKPPAGLLSPAIATQPAEDTLWYKDAIIYQLHVKAFCDSNGDGIGDFSGLTQRLDYLRDLGVTALLLQPFYPSPGRDDGYDVADYAGISPDFGTMKDFRRFMTEAKRRDIKVITELVINHTSDQHPWFQRARRAKPGSEARNWYVWSDTDQRYLGARVIFTDTEKSNWTWDPVADAYYWHRFFSHQPDLNYANPRVVQAMLKMMRGWLELGVDGFRLDAIPYLCEREGTSNENLPRLTPSSKGSAPSSLPTRPAACCSPTPINGRKTRRPISVTATNARWPVTFLSCRASIWRSRRRTTTPSTTSCSRPRPFRPAASGRCSCAITMSSPSRW